MKNKLIIAILPLAFAGSAFAQNVFVTNDAAHPIPITGGAGGAGDASAANQTAVQANAGSDATKAISIQGITSGKAVPISAASLPSHAVTNAGTFAVQVSTQVGAANLATGQVTAGSAGTLVIARATRRQVTVKNTDTSITVYIGPATVTSGNGMPVKAGESITVRWVGLVQVLAASGSPVVAYMDEYD